MTGIRISLTTDDTIFPNAEPIITPTERSMTFPLDINCLNSFKVEFPFFKISFLLTLLFAVISPQ